MDRRRKIHVSFTEEEAFELLMRCVNSDEDDNSTFQSAMSKLADAIKGDHQAAA